MRSVYGPESSYVAAAISAPTAILGCAPEYSAALMPDSVPEARDEINKHCAAEAC